MTDDRGAEPSIFHQLAALPVPTLFLEPGTARLVFANEAAVELAAGALSDLAALDAVVRVARGERLAGVEVNWPTPTRKTSSFHVYGDTLPAVPGQPSICMVMFHDVSQIKEVDAELRRTNQAKDDFLSMLAHELRNPLGPVLNAVYILRRSESVSQSTDQALSVVERQVCHMARLIDDLLDVSRLIRGRIQLKHERLELGSAVRTACEDHRANLEKAGLVFMVDVPDVPIWVNGDVTRLAQILDNLLTNAEKFTEPGGRVDVHLKADPDNNLTQLSVADTGVGIEPGMLPRLFEPLNQADRSLHRTKGGLGLGLAIVKGLSELHGGNVQARSRGTGYGAEFVVSLPLLQERPALSEPAPVGNPLYSVPTVQPLHILVVEDNRDAADSLRMLLELLGHEVRVAYTGPDGVRIAEEWQPDLMLCDIGLPGLDGYGVAGALRQKPATARTRMIAITGYGTEKDRRRALEAGFDHHLTKPADPGVLMQLIRSQA